MKRIIELILLLSILLNGCEFKSTEKKVINSNDHSLDTIDHSNDVDISDNIQSDYFQSKIKSFNQLYSRYNPAIPLLIDTLTSLDQHWFFKIIEKNRRIYSRDSSSVRFMKKLRKLPKISDYKSITQIRKADFKGASGLEDLTIENWSFDTETSAYNWYIIMTDSLRGSRFTKPPRFQWINGKELYLFTIKSAAHWFSFRDSVAIHMTGRSVSQLQKIHRALNLKNFKKWSGPSHSSPSNGEPSSGEPSSISSDSTLEISKKSLFDYNDFGFYEYFYFKGQRYTGAERASKQSEYPSPSEFKIITSLHKPFTGNEQYNEIQETLVAIDCSIVDDDLGSLNLIGQHQNQLEPLFGQIINQGVNYQTYGYANRLFTFQIENDTVRSFRYRWFKD